MKNSKVQNYSDSDVLSILTAFDSVSDYDQQKQTAINVAESLSKSVRQILGKVQYLSRNGAEKSDGSPLYIKAEYVPKTGGKVVRKAELVAEIATLLNVQAEVLNSLESATKVSLELLVKGLNK